MAVSLTATGLIMPASINASSDVNTLDDYEEGTWSPAANGGWGTNPSEIDCHYVVTGKCVNLTGYWVATGGSSGDRAVNTNGLPFSCAQPGACQVDTINLNGANGNFYAQIFSGGSDEVKWHTNGGTLCGWNIFANYAV